MTKGEAILLSITVDMIADGIHEKYCDKARCEECPVYKDCNNIFNEIGKSAGVEPSCLEVIKHWLNRSK